MTYLLDTNVLSAIRTKSGRARIRRWLQHAPSDELFLSVITLGEMQRSIEKLRRKDASDVRRLEDWLNHIISSFTDRIIPVDEMTALAWGRMPPKARGDHADALIAATALTRGLTVVSRNVKDFESRGVQVLNPFEPA